MANRGKSTFFKAATLAEAEIGNYPFTTIDKNEGVSYVKIDCVDKEFKVQCNPRFGYCIDNQRFVPVKIIDVAGLVPGAHEGKGRGNQFLDDLRQADVLIHVIDISGSVDENGNPQEPLSYNPLHEIEILEHELDMWYFGILKKGWEKFARKIKQENQDVKKALAKQLSGLNVNEDMVQDAIKKLKLIHHPTEWSNDDLKELSRELRRVTKPTIIAANKIDILGAKLNFDKLKERFKDYIIVPCSAESELALKEAHNDGLIEYIPGEKDFKILKEDKLNDKQKQALELIKNLLKEFDSTGIQECLNKSIFDLLKYMAIFPGGMNNLKDSDGNVLPDCFLLKEDSTALEFAYKIHQDIGDNFIKAMDVKKRMPVGKEHKLKHRDVIEIMVKK